MYEQYTDKQIVEMLVPKLNKSTKWCDWSGIIKYPKHNENLIKAIATIYRSAYIRGQLGRSFIIGEPKQTERWVPITEDNVKVGNKVRYLNVKKHLESPEFYPLQGTIGEVVSVCNDNICLVQWPGYTASWYASRFDLEVLLCE